MRLRFMIPGAAILTAARYSLLALACFCLGIYAASTLDRVLYQAQENREFNRLLESRDAPTVVSGGASALTGRAARSTRKTASEARLPAPDFVIGRLSVPRLHLSAMVREGTDRDTLQIAVGHVPATPLPGQAGNVGVAGHRDTFFRGLKDVRARDQIRFSTKSGDFTYVVESLSIVEPGDLGVLAPSSENVLTLVTCYPFAYIGSAPKRFVVKARQTTPTAVPPSSVE